MAAKRIVADIATQEPGLAVSVDNLDGVCRRAAAAGLPIAFGPDAKPWDVRRFYVRDPFGRLVYILTHDRGSAPLLLRGQTLYIAAKSTGCDP